MNVHRSEARRQFVCGAMEALVLLACSSPWVLGSTAAKPEEAAMPRPIVPFFTTVDPWDHHWFLWLPHHPVYEAVEVASREPDRDGLPDVAGGPRDQRRHALQTF